MKQIKFRGSTAYRYSYYLCFSLTFEISEYNIRVGYLRKQKENKFTSFANARNYSKTKNMLNIIL